ncbi:MAG: hypothetical protein ACREIR_15830 [Geminicoccaceae bacterium]
MNWLQLVSASLGAVAGYLLKFYLDRRKAAEERAFVDKREHYRNLLLCLKSLREGKSEHTELLWFEYSFLWLHAPDPVIRSANALVAKIEGGAVEAEDLAPSVGELLLQIRRDMGFPKTSLLHTDFKGKLG